MRKIISWIVVILCMALIFNLSSQPAEQSGKLSGKVTNIYIKVIEKVKPNAKASSDRSLPSQRYTEIPQIASIDKQEQTFKI